MTTPRNENFRNPRRLRIDSTAPARPAERFVLPPPPGHSGRWLVGLGVLAVLALWLGLYVAFREWRAGVRQRTAFGVHQVATAVDPLNRLEPPDIDPSDWRQAVAETRAALVTLTSANILNLADMEALRGQVQARVERIRSRPSTARAELSSLWDDLAAGAGHVLDRHPRPQILEPPQADPTKRDSFPLSAPGPAPPARR